MADSKIAEAAAVPSFLIECLVWNVPDDRFAHAAYANDVRESLRYLHHQTKDDDACDDWCEVNGIKYLFRNTQPWTRQQANEFVLSAWHYVGFES